MRFLLKQVFIKKVREQESERVLEKLSIDFLTIKIIIFFLYHENKLNIKISRSEFLKCIYSSYIAN